MTTLSTSGDSSLFPRQFLARFQSKTHVVSLEDVVEHDADNTTTGSSSAYEPKLLRIISHRTGWPVSSLLISHANFPFVQIRAKSSILGGKGGFGTLLKGQSRQAGAKKTTDFGACRDLQGRRLRHVNDEIKLRKWRERKRREANGETVSADDMWNTASGLYNWHLQVPTWADVSKKDTNRIKRQFQKMDQKLEKEIQLKKEKAEAYQKTMTHYLDQTNSLSESVQKSLGDAIKQGLLSKQQKEQPNIGKENKRKRTDDGSMHYSPDNNIEEEFEEQQPNSLVSLTGDVVVESDTDSIKIQSKSEFMTAVYVSEQHGEKDDDSSLSPSYYYEVTLVTGGLAQIGWACLVCNTSHGKSMAFTPSNDLGDGVGDDDNSYAVDGSRGLKFHGGEDWKFPIQWKAGDRLGCLLDFGSSNMSFTLNGNDLGVAFSNLVYGSSRRPLIPAFSCNEGEILELHLTKEACKYFPSADSVVAVKQGNNSSQIKESNLNKETNSTSQELAAPEKKTSASSTENSPPVVSQNEEKVSKAPPPAKAVDTPPTKPELLDLDPYNSVSELEALGLERLKSALMALKVKCGGTLQQRAERLFSLKGLEYKDFPKKVRAKGFVEKQKEGA